MEKFKGKYKIPSARLQSWDYAWDGAYFITICTKDKTHYFGAIANGKMQLSHLGILADVLWYEIKHHAHNLELGEFVVMPNHIHGILILNNNDNDGNCRDRACPVSTPTINTSADRNIGQQRFPNQGKNTISSIIGGYKSAVTKHAHRLGYKFAWQSRFYDHIIRNEKSYNYIVEYIKRNPRTWQEDKFYPQDNF